VNSFKDLDLYLSLVICNDGRRGDKTATEQLASWINWL
jgi:hypothetical protein